MSHSSVSHVLIRCEVSEGIFPEEVIVAFKIGDKTISASVGPESIIDDDKLSLEVYDRENGSFLVGIPGESFSSTRRVWIPESLIVHR